MARRKLALAFEAIRRECAAVLSTSDAKMSTITVSSEYLEGLISRANRAGSSALTLHNIERSLAQMAQTHEILSQSVHELQALVTSNGEKIAALQNTVDTTQARVSEAIAKLQDAVANGGDLQTAAITEALEALGKVKTDLEAQGSALDVAQTDVADTPTPAE